MRYSAVSEQGKRGILWTVFDGAPFVGERIASFANQEDAREYLNWKESASFSQPPADDETVESVRLKIRELSISVSDRSSDVKEWTLARFILEREAKLKEQCNRLQCELGAGTVGDYENIYTIANQQAHELQKQAVELLALRNEQVSHIAIIADMNTQISEARKEWRGILKERDTLQSRVAELEKALQDAE